jgi:hypothetical protein
VAVALTVAVALAANEATESAITSTNPIANRGTMDASSTPDLAAGAAIRDS